jgi:hypothetical protein
MNNLRYVLPAACALLSVLSVCGCVGKRPDDDVALIKQMLARFERGVDQDNEAVLDSIALDKKLNLSSRLLDSLSLGKELAGGRIAEKRFVILGDSAEVKLRLSLEYSLGGGEVVQMEKPLRLFLRKKRGKWRIQDFAGSSDQADSLRT